MIQPTGCLLSLISSSHANRDEELWCVQAAGLTTGSICTRQSEKSMLS